MVEREDKLLPAFAVFLRDGGAEIRLLFRESSHLYPFLDEQFLISAMDYDELDSDAVTVEHFDNLLRKSGKATLIAALEHIRGASTEIASKLQGAQARRGIEKERFLAMRIARLWREILGKSPRAWVSDSHNIRSKFADVVALAISYLDGVPGRPIDATRLKNLVERAVRDSRRSGRIGVGLRVVYRGGRHRLSPF